jgi:hypothetical protein
VRQVAETFFSSASGVRAAMSETARARAANAMSRFVQVCALASCSAVQCVLRVCRTAQTGALRRFCALASDVARIVERHMDEDVLGAYDV